MQSEPTAPYLVCVWIGGFIYWLLNGFAGKYSDQLTDERRSRNFWTGYVISMIFLVALVFTMFKFFSS